MLKHLNIQPIFPNKNFGTIGDLTLVSSQEYMFTVFPPYLQLVVVRADLNGHLKALKDYFLLAKGDFFQV